MAGHEYQPAGRVPAPGLLTHQPGDGRFSPLHVFLLLRSAVILVTACLLWAEAGLRPPSAVAVLLITSALLSNVLIVVRPEISRSASFGPALIVGDTLWISAALLVTRRFDPEFFFVYFFLLLLAALGEYLWLIALAALAVCGAYFHVLPATGEPWALWSSPSLIRLPLLFVIAAYYGFLIDRTRAERRRAQEADRIKAEFLGTISHELRTPLTVVLGYVDLLLENEFGVLTPEQRTALGKVQAAGTNLHTYLSRLLDVSRLVSRLHSGRETVVASEFALASVFSELRYDFLDLLGARIEWPATGDLPPLNTDRDKLVTILRNLIENALKYGGGAPTTVSVRRDEDADQLLVTIADRGIGIAPADLPHVFDPFRRTAQAAASNAQGVGLGLYIVKQFTELLRGTIEVTSTPGMGSTFVVRIPWHLPARPSGRAAA